MVFFRISSIFFLEILVFPEPGIFICVYDGLLCISCVNVKSVFRQGKQINYYRFCLFRKSRLIPICVFKVNLWSLNHIKISMYLCSTAFLLKYVALECNPCCNLNISVFSAWVSGSSLCSKCCAEKSNTVLIIFFFCL